jgi:hypothetical protein
LLVSVARATLEAMNTENSIEEMIRHTEQHEQSLREAPELEDDKEYDPEKIIEFSYEAGRLVRY